MGLDDPLGCEWLLDEQVDLHNVILGVLENQPLKRCLFCVIPYVGDLDLSCLVHISQTCIRNVEGVLAPLIAQDRVDKSADVGITHL